MGGQRLDAFGLFHETDRIHGITPRATEQRGRYLLLLLQSYFPLSIYGMLLSPVVSPNGRNQHY